MPLTSFSIPFRSWALALAASLSIACATTRPEPATTAVPVEHPGCFLLMDLRTGQVTRVNPERCTAKLLPASTFKVPHALIALETGVLSGVDEVRRWDGTKRSIEAWNQDQTLDTAMRRSAVWFFQETAQQIGRERMEEWLRRLDYGNADASGDLTRFWLDGTLRISPEEQLRFMARLYRNELPVSKRSRELVKGTLAHGPDTVANSRSGVSLWGPWKEGAVLSAKTGYGQLEGEGTVTWLVGHVQAPGREHVFVSSVLTAESQPEPPLALVGAIQALQGLGLL